MTAFLYAWERQGPKCINAKAANTKGNTKCKAKNGFGVCAMFSFQTIWCRCQQVAEIS